MGSIRNRRLQQNIPVLQEMSHLHVKLTCFTWSHFWKNSKHLCGTVTHSVQHIQWGDFHCIQFSTISWKLPSHDLMWKIKTSHVFHLTAIEKKNAYLWQQFSIKAIYLLNKKKPADFYWAHSHLSSLLRSDYIIANSNTTVLYPTNQKSWAKLW